MSMTKRNLIFATESLAVDNVRLKEKITDKDEIIKNMTIYMAGECKKGTHCIIYPNCPNPNRVVDGLCALHIVGHFIHAKAKEVEETNEPST